MRTFASRRDFLNHAMNGVGGLALAAMLQQEQARANPLAPKRPHRPAKAKAVISIFC